MAQAEDMITIGGRRVLKFWPLSKPITDGIVRCMFCGQVDEPEFHDDDLVRSHSAAL